MKNKSVCSTLQPWHPHGSGGLDSSLFLHLVDGMAMKPRGQGCGLAARMARRIPVEQDANSDLIKVPKKERWD